MQTSKKASYFNTLIFTIISGIVSLILLAMLFFDVFRPYIPFIITVEVGIFAIILFCIYKIYTIEKVNELIKADKNFSIDFMQCPDYYVTKKIDGKTICSNEYMIEDQYRKKSIMKIYPADVLGQTTYSFPQNHSVSYTNLTNPQEKFDLTSFATTRDLATNQQRCNAVFGQNDTYRHYSKLPWTSIKSKCDSYV